MEGWGGTVLCPKVFIWANQAHTQNSKEQITQVKAPWFNSESTGQWKFGVDSNSITQCFSYLLPHNFPNMLLLKTTQIYYLQFLSVRNPGEIQLVVLSQSLTRLQSKYQPWLQSSEGLIEEIYLQGCPLIRLWKEAAVPHLWTSPKNCLIVLTRRQLVSSR